MPRHLIVVEGAHDAAFLGKLLEVRGYSSISTLPEVPRFWAPAIPRSYPVRTDLALERVITFPEIHQRAADGSTVGVVVANGDSGLLRALRDFLDLFEAPDFASLAVVLDTDWGVSEGQRFSNFLALTAPWNLKAQEDDRPGFPLVFPEQAGTIQAGNPRVGIYQFPGGGAQGALENVLLACARHHHPALHDRAEELVDDAIALYPVDADPDPLKGSRKPSGSAKARCGILANILKPGASLAVSIRDTEWLPDDEDALPEVARAAQFLDALLAD